MALPKFWWFLRFFVWEAPGIILNLALLVKRVEERKIAEQWTLKKWKFSIKICSFKTKQKLTHRRLNLTTLI